MTRERLEETLSKLHFSSNEETFAQEDQDHEGTFKVQERLKCDS